MAEILKVLTASVLVVGLLLTTVVMVSMAADEMAQSDGLTAELKRSPMLKTQDARNFFARLRK